MPFFKQDGIDIHYKEHGNPNGFPVLLIAPGGMKSTMDAWDRMPWDPRERLSDYRVIAMDQRNAGRSSGPIPIDGWLEYTADQLALLEYLRVDQFHVVGMCIGGPYIAGLIFAARERVRSAVMMQPIGLDENRQAFFDMFNGWMSGIRSLHPETSVADWNAFRDEMFGGEFLFNASEELVKTIETPILLLHGADLYHPASISQRLDALLPNVTSVVQWKTGDALAAADATIQAWLSSQGS